MTNKFDDYFNTNMSSSEARSKFFSLAESCTKSELEMLKKAYSPVMDLIVIRELQYYRNNEMMC